MHMQKRTLWTMCVAALAVTACTKNEPAKTEPAGAAAPAAAPRKNARIAVVTHGQASDTFWSVVKNGVDRAAKDVGAEVTYNAPQTFDMVAMSRLIDAEVAKKPD